MKGSLLFALLLLAVMPLFAQTINWTWQGGSSSSNQRDIYGTKGVANYNNSPNARQGSACWTDKDGNFWLFGGYGGYSPYQDDGLQYYFNDLWEYNPNTYEWTWISGSDTINQPGVYGLQGVAVNSNMPGSRQGAVTWVDASGNFWLFGGSGFDSTRSPAFNPSYSYLNDLWKYNPSTNQWTWVSGTPSHNVNGVYGRQSSATGGYPGGRTFATGSIDASGNLWLCSGTGYDAINTSTGGTLIDVWEYIPSSNSWIWESGSNQINQLGTYGTKGTGSTSNIPGSRFGASSFFDNAGNFWLFGGNGYTGTTGDNDGDLNDLWEYTPSTHVWTWVSGTDQGNQDGMYGTEGVYAAGNMPGGREGCFAWQDFAKNIWIFGGYGKDSVGFYGGNLNDLWEYSLAGNQWVWRSGSMVGNQTGTYGIVGASSSTKFPGSRAYGGYWKDKGGNLWLFGGTGYGITATSYQAYLSDVWEITVPSNALPVTLLQLQAERSGNNAIVTWQVTDEINSFGYNVQRSTDGIHFTTIGQVKAKNEGSLPQTYSYTDAAIASLTTNIYYRVQEVDINGASMYSKIVSVLKTQNDVAFIISPNPAKNNLNIVFNGVWGNALITVFDMNGKPLFKQNQLIRQGNAIPVNLSGFAAGTYFVHVTINGNRYEQKFVKE